MHHIVMLNLLAVTANCIFVCMDEHLHYVLLFQIVVTKLCEAGTLIKKLILDPGEGKRKVLCITQIKHLNRGEREGKYATNFPLSSFPFILLCGLKFCWHQNLSFFLSFDFPFLWFMISIPKLSWKKKNKLLTQAVHSILTHHVQCIIHQSGSTSQIL